jgi:hypothetical protein
MKNREKYREFFEFDVRVIEFCPKLANLGQEQGVNRELARNEDSRHRGELQVVLTGGWTIGECPVCVPPLFVVALRLV